MEDDFGWFNALKFVIEKYEPKDKKLGFEIMQAIISSRNRGDISSNEGKELWELLYPKLLRYEND